MSVDYQLDEYTASVSTWLDIDNIINKTNLYSYLRELAPGDKSQENIKRNEDYKKHALFYAFASYTLAGLVGEIFAKDPVIDLPEGINYLIKKADDNGNSILQVSQTTTREIIKKGRAGLFVTFPDVEGIISAEDAANITATINHVDANRIINWQTDGVKLTLVVFKENIESLKDDGFTRVIQPSCRELRLVGGVFVDRKWIKNNEGEWIVKSEKIPKNHEGNNWAEVPFCFVGSENNDSRIDGTNMSDLVNINISHYRNSADYEDNVWYSGQSQPWMSGIDESHIEMMKKEGVYVGSRHLMPVPSGESFGFASADPNPLARQAMQDKIDLAIAIGSRLIQSGGTVKTATQSAGEQRISVSILSLISSNVSDAYKKSIDFVGQYMGVDTDSVAFELNKDFIPETASSADIKEMIAGWIGGAIPEGEYIRYMQSIGRFDSKKSIEEISEELGA